MIIFIYYAFILVVIRAEIWRGGGVAVTAVGFAVNLMKFWLSVLLFVHLFILVNSFHLWSKWFEWRRVFYSASSLVVQFIFLVM